MPYRDWINELPTAGSTARHARDWTSREAEVILACAISAGIHGALVLEHFAEGFDQAWASSSRPSRSRSSRWTSR